MKLNLNEINITITFQNLKGLKFKPLNLKTFVQHVDTITIIPKRMKHQATFKIPGSPSCEVPSHYICGIHKK